MTYVRAQKVWLEPMRTAAFGSIGASYTVMGDPCGFPILGMKVRSTLDVDVILSLDGSTDQIPVAANDNFKLEFGNLKQGTGMLYLPKGTKIYQKRASGAPGSGNLYIALMYGR